MARDPEEWRTPPRQSTDWTVPTPDTETWNARSATANNIWPPAGYLLVVDGNGDFVVDGDGRFVTANG